MMATGQYGGMTLPPPIPQQPGGGMVNTMAMPPPGMNRPGMMPPQYGGGGGGVRPDFPNVSQQQPPQSSNSSRPLDLKLILNRDQVTYLFGFDGVLIGQLRQQTGAHIVLNDGDSFEHVLRISGSIELIFKAFSLVCRKLWDLMSNAAGPGHQRPLVLRLAVPASQCGSIIGKQGSKVKEIRELTGAQIQVSQDSLPDSTERCVEISGSGESCLQCTYHICCVMQETPIRGDQVPYMPKSKGGGGMPPPMGDWRPVFLCGDKAYIVEGRFARPAPPELLRRELAQTPLGGDVAETLANNSVNNQHSNQSPDHMNPLALMAAISKAQRGGSNASNQPQTSKEMTVNSDMIKTMMARSNGQKLNEIQRMSGAQIHVAAESETLANGDRHVTLSGSEESILLAQFLIQSNIDIIMKEQREGANNSGRNSSSSGSNNAVKTEFFPTNQLDPSIMGGSTSSMQQQPSQQQDFNSGGQFHDRRASPYDGRDSGFRGNRRGGARGDRGGRGRGRR